MLDWINQKIGRQLLTVFYALLAVVSLTSLFVYDYTESQLSESKENLLTVSERNARANDLWQDWQEVQFGLRGYVIFGDEKTFEEVESYRLGIKEKTEWFEENVKSAEGREFVAQMNSLYSSYYGGLLPLSEAYVSGKKNGEINEDFLQGDTLLGLPVVRRLIDQGVLKESAGGTIDVVPDIERATASLENYRASLAKEQADSVAKLQEEVASTQMIWLSSIVVLILFLFLFIHPYVRNMSRHLMHLVDDNKRLTEGEEIGQSEVLKRRDEIGLLRESFNQMAMTTVESKKNMQTKNEELQAQQEELIAQQEELQAQQEELEDAYETTKRNEENLKFRNELTEALAVRETVEAYPAIIQKMASITGSEYGALILFEKNGTFKATTYGMDDDQVAAAVTEETSAVRRMRLLRQTVQSEKQIAMSIAMPYPFHLYEVALPIFEPETHELLAAIYLVRFKEPYREQQLADMNGFVQQLTLSLLRTRSYEEMKREKQKTEQVLDSIREAVLYIEDGSKEIYVNRPLFDLIPELASEFQADRTLSSIQYILDVMRSIVDDVPAFDAYVAQIASRRPPEEVLRFDVRNNSAHLQIYAERISVEGGWQGLILVIRDSTLETEADRLKTELVSTVSHELRTPLTSIYGFTELMLSRKVDEMKQKKYLKTIHMETERLSNLVTDFLDVQRMQSGKHLYQMAHLDVVSLVDEVVDFYRTSHPERTIELHAIEGEAPEIIADEARIKQLLSNLISNAVKYSPEGGVVSVAIGMKNEFAVIEISDEGIGIPQNALAHLFEKFFRVDNSDTRRIGGTGLGLSICKEIVKEHEGTIHVDSIEGKGSTFTVMLPLTIPEYV